MAIAHHCLACGTDLARVRVDRMNPYHLPLVHCPRCGTSAVRERDQLVALWRRVRRIVLAVGQMSVRVVFLVLCTFLSTMALFGGVASIMDWNREPSDGVAPHWLIALASAGLVLVGAAVATAFGHHPRFRAWLGFVLWWLFALVVVPALAVVLDAAPGRAAEDLRRLVRSEETVLAVLLFIPACVLMTIGLPIGTFLHRAGAIAGMAMRRRQWRRLRAARRFG
jgi:hypothetical protein